jgi:hypothetical protein
MCELDNICKRAKISENVDPRTLTPSERAARQYRLWPVFASFQWPRNDRIARHLVRTALSGGGSSGRRRDGCEMTLRGIQTLGLLKDFSQAWMLSRICASCKRDQLPGFPAGADDDFFRADSRTLTSRSGSCSRLRFSGRRSLQDSKASA